MITAFSQQIIKQSCLQEERYNLQAQLSQLIAAFRLSLTDTQKERL